MPEPIVLNSFNFEDTVLKSETLFLVDFWAPWCGPCRSIGPIVDQIATEQAGSLSVGKLNIVDHPEIADEYRVSSIPNLILFKDGKPVASSLGLKAKELILKDLEPYI